MYSRSRPLQSAVVFLASCLAFSAKAQDAAIPKPETTPSAPPEATTPTPSAEQNKIANSDQMHIPAHEQLVHTPLPIYVEPPAGMAAAKVVVVYKSFATNEWHKLELSKLGAGWGGEIPCNALTTTGALSYYILVSDNEGDVITTSGTRVEPIKVPIRYKITDAAPHLPGRAPPTRCRETADCPPGLPGCSANAKSATLKGWEQGDAIPGKTCDSNADCLADEQCTHNVCEARPQSIPSWWLSFNVQQDVSLVSSQSNVCGTPSNEPPPNFTCLTQADATYKGIPARAASGDDNTISGGANLSTTRLMLEAMYLLTANIGVAARFGYVFRTTPDRTLSKLHAEARLSYWFGRDPFREQSVRPYVALALGLAEASDEFDVRVSETLCSTDAECATKGLALRPKLSAWRSRGAAFGGASLGLMLKTAVHQGVTGEIKAQLYFPDQAFTLSPVVGYALGF